VLRPQEVSNHPEVTRRLGLIALNTALECDIYGNVNATPVGGTQMMNGIGGSGDFACNAACAIFATKSIANERRSHFEYRADGPALRSQRARCRRDRHRTGLRRPARPRAAQAHSARCL